MSDETFSGQSMLENLKISLTSIEKAQVTQPNIYSLGMNDKITNFFFLTGQFLKKHRLIQLGVLIQERLPFYVVIWV